MELSETLNMDYIDDRYAAWREDPGSVSRQWQIFFEGFEIAAGDRRRATAHDREGVLRQLRVQRLIERYREIGHLLACMDPLDACPTAHPLLDLEAFGLTLEDLQETFVAPGFAADGEASLADIIAALQETYCRSIGVEYSHLQDPDERRWLQERMEPERNRPDLDASARKQVLYKLCEAALFEQFLNRKYVGVTRFSLEGGEVLIPVLDTLLERLAGQGCEEIILGMAHRGRLNVQCHVLGKPYEEIFGEFESCYDPDSLVGSGDVKYHNGYLGRRQVGSGRSLRMFLVNNPSHLEAVNAVAEGLARGRQDLLGDDAHERVVPLLIHGDAAFAGQGVVAEVLNMSQLEGYRTGGTLHLVINNQIGYTTLPEDARSTRYATDMAKMLMVPIFHVHGENPEAAVHVIKLAADYRAAFHKDVVVDIICYRRYGHNEGDEPYFTQPQMYDRIRERSSLNRVYAAGLQEAGIVDASHLETVEKRIDARLEAAFEEVHGSACPFPEAGYFEQWDGFHGRHSHKPAQTGVPRKTLVQLARALSKVPEGFALHRKLQGLLERRLKAVNGGSGIDWAAAESLAFATLLRDGVAVRLSGQDSERGTFSQRHSVLVDTQSGNRHVPLNHLGDGQAPFRVYNSLLAEAGVLGFDYGYSLADPAALVLWEAQFGDFANNAQAVFDLFIASGEAKWQRLSGLTLLLPHGYEGLGPEHSSARPERFLQLCAGDNIRVCNATTPAQYFHLLRRQVEGRARKPLVVMTPKSLLRHPRAVSDLADLAAGAFREVLDDPAGRRGVDEVVLCSGKIYYELVQRRETLERDTPALVRVEQLYPFPHKQLEAVAGRYPKARHWRWVQEEPANMGAWSFVRHRLEDLLGRGVTYIGREAAASPATGFPALYKAQQEKIIATAVGSAP